MFGHRTSSSSLILLRTKTKSSFLSRRNLLHSSIKFRCLLDQFVPQAAFSASLSSLLTSGNLIAAAGSSGSVHGAVSSAITQVAVTAVAIASGACLSTKVDFLWPKVQEQPGSLILDGVDVTGYPIFNDAKAGAEGN